MTVSISMKYLTRTGLLICLVIFSPSFLQAQFDTPADRLFERAHTLYEAGMYHRASALFLTFTERFAGDARYPEALFYAAESAFAAGEMERAIPLFERFQREYPEHPLHFDANLLLSKYFYDQQEYPQAVKLLQRVLHDQPPPELAARTLYWLAQAHLHLHETKQAISYLTAILDQYPATEVAPSGLYALAYIYVRQKAYARAASAFEQLMQAYPTSPFARDIPLSLAEAYYETGEYRRAIETIQRHLGEFQGEAYERALFILAESYNQLGSHSDAIIYYRRFVEQYPESPYYRHALYGLAWNYHFSRAYEWAANTFKKVWKTGDDALAHQAMYYEGVNLKLAGQIDEALKRFAAVAIRWPEGPLSDEALFERGMTFYELREWEKAQHAFEKVVRNYPESDLRGEAYRMLAETYVAQGLFDNALAAYDSAITWKTAPPELRRKVSFQKAWTLYRTGHYEEAAKAFHALYNENNTDDIAPDALFWAAESYYQTKNYNRAEQLFTLYLQRFPNHRQVDAAHYALGWTYFKQQRYRLAARAFETFLKTYRTDDLLIPYREDAQLRLADSYFALKNYGRAIAEYRKVKGAGEDYALYQIGKAYEHQGNVYQAVTHFKKLLERYPDSPWCDKALFSIGYLYFLNQDYTQAIAHFEQLLKEYPRSPLAPRALYSIGDALYNAGRFEEAMATYRRVLNEYPQSTFVLDAIAGIQYALVALNREDEVSAVVDSFVQQHPDSPLLDEVRFRDAEIKFQSGDFEAAIAAFQRFIRTARTPRLLAAAYLYLGKAYAELERYEEAIAYLQQLIARYPNREESLEAGLRLGEIYLSQERYADALELYRKLETQSQKPEVRATIRYHQGISLMFLGRLNDAARVLEQVVQETEAGSPLHNQAKLALARVQDQQNATLQALTLYREVAQSSSDETGAEALYRMAEILHRQGKKAEALEELKRIPVLFPGFSDWVARSYLLQAEIYRERGQKGMAQQLYERVLREFPHTPFAQIAANEKDR